MGCIDDSTEALKQLSIHSFALLVNANVADELNISAERIRLMINYYVVK